MINQQSARFYILAFLFMANLGHAENTEFSFHPHKDYRPIGGTPQTVAIADMNGDGRMDLVVAQDTFDCISVLLQNPDGTFSAVGGSVFPPDGPAKQSPKGVHVRDINRDGKPDMIVSNWMSNEVSIKLGDEKGKYSKSYEFPVGKRPETLDIADFNGDGNEDLVVANSEDGTVSLLLGDGKGGLGPGKTISVGPGPLGIAAGDLDSDGNVDVVVANSGIQGDRPFWDVLFGLKRGISVHFGDGKGSFSKPLSLTDCDPPDGVVLGDFNNDKRMDILSVSPPFLRSGLFNKKDGGSFTVYANGGNRKFIKYKEIKVAGGPYDVAVADFNGDGNLDLATILSGFTVALFRGDGSGGFSLRQLLKTGERPENLAAADLDNNGCPDIVTANWGSHSISVLIANCSTKLNTK